MPVLSPKNSPLMSQELLYSTKRPPRPNAAVPFASYVIHMPFLWNSISEHVLFHVCHQALQKRRFSRLCQQRPGSIPALLTRTWSWGSGLSVVFSPLQRFFLGNFKIMNISLCKPNLDPSQSLAYYISVRQKRIYINMLQQVSEK